MFCASALSRNKQWHKHGKRRVLGQFVQDPSERQNATPKHVFLMRLSAHLSFGLLMSATRMRRRARRMLNHAVRMSAAIVKCTVHSKSRFQHAGMNWPMCPGVGLVVDRESEQLANAPEHSRTLPNTRERSRALASPRDELRDPACVQARQSAAGRTRISAARKPAPRGSMRAAPDARRCVPDACRRVREPTSTRA